MSLKAMERVIEMIDKRREVGFDTLSLRSIIESCTTKVLYDSFTYDIASLGVHSETGVTERYSIQDKINCPEEKRNLPVSEVSFEEFIETIGITNPTMSEMEGYVFLKNLYMFYCDRPSVTYEQFLYMVQLNRFNIRQIIVGKEKRSLIITEDLLCDTLTKISCSGFEHCVNKTLYVCYDYKNLVKQEDNHTYSIKLSEYGSLVFDMDKLPTLQEKYVTYSYNKATLKDLKRKYKDVINSYNDVPVATLFSLEYLSRFNKSAYDIMVNMLERLRADNYTEIFEEYKRAVIDISMLVVATSDLFNNSFEYSRIPIEEADYEQENVANGVSTASFVVQGSDEVDGVKYICEYALCSAEHPAHFLLWEDRLSFANMRAILKNAIDYYRESIKGSLQLFDVMIADYGIESNTDDLPVFEEPIPEAVTAFYDRIKGTLSTILGCLKV